MPKTPLGKLSVGLILAFAAWFGLFQILVASGQEGGEGPLDNLWLTIPILLAAGCAFASAATGITGILKARERSPFVFISSLIGVLVSLLVILETIFHNH